MAVAGIVANKAKCRNVLITEQIVSRIMSDLGAEMTAPVKKCFLRCLQVCADWYNDATLYNHGAPQKQYREYLFQIIKAIDELSPFLEVDRLPADARSHLSNLAQFGNLSLELAELNKRLTRIAKLRSDSTPRTAGESDFGDFLKYQDHFKERSPFNWLAGVYLPEV
jgi:hypothetical protein